MLANALNAYYLQQNSDATACDFSGSAQIVKAAAVSSCSSVIASATANAPGASSTGGPGPASSSKKSEGASPVGATLGFGTYAFAAYAATALLSGVGILWL
jgi:hypothetical protein